MPNFKEKIARGWREIRGNIAVELAKWLGGSTVFAAILKIVSQVAHKVPVDWWLFASLLLFGVSLVLYSLYANGSAKREIAPIDMAVQEDSAKDVDAVMFFHFEAQAIDLIKDLEAAWHHWNNVGERLVHPLGGMNNLKTTDTSLMVKLVNESRDFKVRYGDHLMYLRLRLPAFTSNTLQHGYPNDREYYNVLSDLQMHRASLESAGRAALGTTSVVIERSSQSFGLQPCTLTTDALQLSVDLLEFLKKLGPEPAPKYSREQIWQMPDHETRRLIEVQDGDFSEACAYHAGDHRIFPLSSEDLYRGMANRHNRMIPWYEKVRASYALEMKSKVETIHNRFALEGFTNANLVLPVQDFDGVKNVQIIAATLWELAFKLEEKKANKAV